MPEYLAPGVFVEEIDSGSKPLEGVGTNTTAFIGYAKSGDFHQPTFVTNFTQFCRVFGEEENAILRSLADELDRDAESIYNDKVNARMSWIEFAMASIEEKVIVQTLSSVTKKSAKELTDDKSAQRKSWRAYAEPIIQDRKKLGADIEDTWKKFQERVKRDNPQVDGQVYIPGSYLAHAVKGYYDNGGGRAWIIRIPRPYDEESRGYRPNGKAAVGGGQSSTQIGGLTFTPKATLPPGTKLEVAVEHVGDDEFKLSVKPSSGDPEQFGFGKDAKDKPLKAGTAAAALKGSQYFSVTAVDTATRPAAQVYEVVVAEERDVPVVRTSNSPSDISSADGALAAADDFVGDEAKRTGAKGLAPIEDINMICFPDLMAGLFVREPGPAVNGGGTVERLDRDALKARRTSILNTQKQLIDYCERSGDRMCILDPLPDLRPDEVRDVCLNEAKFSSDHGQGTIYYPWIKVTDPLQRGAQMFCPPSGHVAGVWVRTAQSRGVHKAPANEAILGAVALERELTKGEQEILNPEGINCIRAFPGTGIRIWGARTLATRGNPSWKYVNVRRLFNYLERTMDRGLQWVVFEPNDEDLWGRVRRTLNAFLFTEWKEGKLFGATPAEAYYVKCDHETNPQEMIDLGRLYVEIGVNPVKPAEFVIIRIGQWSGGGSSSEQ